MIDPRVINKCHFSCLNSSIVTLFSSKLSYLSVSDPFLLSTWLIKMMDQWLKGRAPQIQGEGNKVFMIQGVWDHSI